MIKINYPKLLASILICQLAGIIGSLFTVSSITSWYSAINKPLFSPPNWILGPVWITLYFLMGVSLYIIWDNKRKDKISKTAIRWFIIQLILNTLWTIIFFGLKSPLGAFIEIIILWISIFLTIKYSYKISKTAAYLLIPYILWVSFAAMLNLAIYLANN